MLGLTEALISESWPVFAVFDFENQSQFLFSFYLPSFGGGSRGDWWQVVIQGHLFCSRR